MKVFVMDTSALVHSPTALQSLGVGHIVIPMVVLEELDNLNHGRNDAVSYHARLVIRLIDRLQSEQGSDKVRLDNGATVEMVEASAWTLGSLDGSKADNQILNTAVLLQQIANQTNDEVVLVSNDAGLRTKARKFGLATMPLADDRVNVQATDVYNGWTEYQISPDLIDRFYGEKSLVPEERFTPNEYIILRDIGGGQKSALGRFDARSGAILPLEFLKEKPCDIKPRNVQQTFLIDALMDPKISVVSIPAPAGTGKSLISIACGNQQVDDELYKKVCIFKPLHIIGPDVGFLPGELDDKLGPHMDSIRDSLDFIYGPPVIKKKGQDIIKVSSWQFLLDKDLLEMKSVTHLRGRSLPNLFMIVDEAQNLSPAEIKTIVTRCGEGTKIIFTGDPNQIDCKHLDSQNNGLTFLTERFKGQQCFACVRLTKTERSPLAELGAQLL